MKCEPDADLVKRAEGWWLHDLFLIGKRQHGERWKSAVRNIQVVAMLLENEPGQNPTLEGLEAVGAYSAALGYGGTGAALCEDLRELHREVVRAIVDGDLPFFRRLADFAGKLHKLDDFPMLEAKVAVSQAYLAHLRRTGEPPALAEMVSACPDVTRNTIKRWLGDWDLPLADGKRGPKPNK